MKNYLFIIPLTPKSLLNKERKTIQITSFEILLSQSHTQWQALVIGDYVPEIVKNNQKFIHINFEGVKEEKLQIATRYILNNNLQPDYIIRLDDDDLFNPGILTQLETIKDFDVFTDKFHSFIHFETKAISQQIRLWFPNTCVHKFEHAMAVYGRLAHNRIEQINDQVRLIENDHSKLHHYYAKKKIVFAQRSSPLYLRVLNSGSITAKSGSSYEQYLKQFGQWRNNDLVDYRSLTLPKNLKPVISYSVKERIYFMLQQFVQSIFYRHLLFQSKNT